MTTLIRRTGAIRTVAFGLLLAFVANMALAVQPDEVLDNPALEARARDISKGLRCLVCQNESIDDSNAPLAADLRAVVRERLLAGDSDAEVKAYLQDRYGDYVLMLPPVQGNTIALWLFPLVVLAGGGIAILVFVRGQRRTFMAGDDTGEEAAEELPPAEQTDAPGSEGASEANG